MRTEIMLAIPISVFKKNYAWMQEYSKVTITFDNNRSEQSLEIPIWKADRILQGCGINPGIISFKIATDDSMLFFADVQRYEKLKNDFIAFCGGSSTDEEAERLQYELLRTNQVIAKINKKSEQDEWIDEDDLDRRMRYKNFLENRLRIININKPVSYVGMFNDILTHDDVDTLDFQNDELIIQTKPIIICYEGTDYLIGRFKITIPRINSDIFMQNLDRQVNERHHPHVPENKKPCWGDAVDSVKACYDNKNYYGLVLLSLCLLNGYYQEGAYQNATIEKWI